MDSVKIAMIASKFFEQHHSDVVVKDVTLEKGIWRVNVSLGLINKHNKQLKIDATTGTILECITTDYERLAAEILAIHGGMRYVLITDDRGNHLLSRIGKGKTIMFKNRNQINMLSSELRTLRELLKFHNDDLGQARFVNIMREKVNIFIHFLPGITVCSSCEYYLPQEEVLDISEKGRKTIEKFIG
ncbi:MAG: hypothetical protein KGI33_07700 [Thaumarchaeota archaeon]|nr:hypothetical protein [Nitrososphaerota archaeon]